jgi:hypothetical protein
MRAVIIMAAAMAACRFDAGEGATRFRCERTSDCPAGLVCSVGWCAADPEPVDGATGGAIDAADPACPCSLWDDDTVPDRLDNNDGDSIEVAVKFRAAVAGDLVALRFYKPALSDGVHIGRVWSPGGALLGEAQYRDETDSGWQEVALEQPVAIQPDTTYIASVYIASGYYAADVSYFLTGYERPPLRALADGDDGSNGVFVLGQGFPDVSSYMGSNYWVDVVFDDG